MNAEQGHFCLPQTPLPGDKMKKSPWTYCGNEPGSLGMDTDSACVDTDPASWFNNR